MHHSEIAENRAVYILQWYPHITDGVHFGEVGVLGEQLDNVFGNMNEAGFMNNRFAGGAREVVFVLVYILAIQEEREGPESALSGIRKLRNPSPRNV
jgi:hypothetical protein